ncbi:hypothetical protein ABBQ38_008754 [Trebouxia sp. C0009 RCD-2024]
MQTCFSTSSLKLPMLISIMRTPLREDPWGSPRVLIRVNIPSVRMCAKGIAGAACKPGPACMRQAMRISRGMDAAGLSEGAFTHYKQRVMVTLRQPRVTRRALRHQHCLKDR